MCQMDGSCPAGADSLWTQPACHAPPGGGLGAVVFTNLLATLLQAQRHLVEPESYPPDVAVPDSEYDFVVVGGGSAGSVMASRLSEVPQWRVLLLEAGGNPSLVTEVPGLFYSAQNTDADWQYRTEPHEGMCLGYIDGHCSWPRGKVLGGSSTINAMVYIRGKKYDYDNWARSGNDGWSYDQVLPYFKKSEHMADEQEMSSGNALQGLTEPPTDYTVSHTPPGQSRLFTVHLDGKLQAPTSHQRKHADITKHRNISAKPRTHQNKQRPKHKLKGNAVQSHTQFPTLSKHAIILVTPAYRPQKSNSEHFWGGGG